MRSRGRGSTQADRILRIGKYMSQMVQCVRTSCAQMNLQLARQPEGLGVSRVDPQDLLDRRLGLIELV